MKSNMPGSGKDIPLSEIVDCIDKVVVDGGGKIVVKWNDFRIVPDDEI